MGVGENSPALRMSNARSDGGDGGGTAGSLDVQVNTVTDTAARTATCMCKYKPTTAVKQSF